jgi:hypothetical protein
MTSTYIVLLAVSDISGKPRTRSRVAVTVTRRLLDREGWRLIHPWRNVAV